MVLIAGYTCDHHFWDCLIPLITDQFQVLLFDNRGIGQTLDQDEDFSIDDMAHDVMTLCHQVGMVNPIVVGQSMGGCSCSGDSKTLFARTPTCRYLKFCFRIYIVAQLALKSLIQLRNIKLILNV